MPGKDELVLEASFKKTFPSHFQTMDLAGSPAKGPICMQELSNIHISTLQAAASYSAGASGQRRKVAGLERQGRRRRAWANPSALCVSFNVASIILQEAKSNPYFRGSNIRARPCDIQLRCVLCIDLMPYLSHPHTALSPLARHSRAPRRAPLQKARGYASLFFFTEFQHRNSALPHKKESASFHFSCAQFELCAQSKFREPHHWLSLKFHSIFAT